jgi:hypothetical protein
MYVYNFHLVVVDFDALQLEFGGSVVVARGFDSMLVGDDLPELKRIGQSILACLKGHFCVVQPNMCRMTHICM